MKDLLIRGSTLIDPSQDRMEKADIRIRKGVVAAVADQLPVDDAELLQADGLYCAPGLVDIHVHLRDPGQTHKEDIFSGCVAAAAGGVTSVVCMPNTNPPVDDPSIVQSILEKSVRADAHVYPVGTITRGLQGQELTDFAILKKAGVCALSDDGKPVPTAGLMAAALKKAAAVGLPVLSHSEDRELAGNGIMHEGRVSVELGVPGIPAQAEEVAIAREIRLAAETGCPVHICHVSTAGSVALLREAKAKGIPVTAETAPHYFTLTHDALRTRDADYRMNPPLRTAADVRAVIHGLQDGTLSIIATDHAPHSAEEKSRGLEKSAFGIVGIETAFPILYTCLVKPGILSLNKLLELLCVNPRRRFGLPLGTDYSIWDLNAAYPIDPEDFLSKGRATPFAGWQVNGKCIATVCDGKLAYAAPETHT